jgi:hypothetical protein
VEEPPVMRFFFGKLEPVRGDLGAEIDGGLQGRIRRRAVTSDVFHGGASRGEIRVM